MLSSLYSGVQGISANASSLGVIGANIANVNTIAYKSGDLTFATILGETVAEGGVKVWGSDKSWAQGSLEYTSKDTDLAVVGAGLFVVEDAEGTDYFTRAGAFFFDKDGILINQDGYQVQGFAIASGTATGSPTDIDISTVKDDPKVTSEMRMAMNLDSATPASGTFSNTITINDSLGNSIPLTLTFTKSSDANTWTVSGAVPEAVSSGTVTFSDETLAFGADGKLLSPAESDITVTIDGLTTGASGTMTINWDLYDEINKESYGEITQFSGSSGVSFQTQNGYATGSIMSLDVGEDGVVTGVFSNGKSRELYQVVVAKFPNYNGLSAVGNNLYAASFDSGLPVIGAPQTGGRGAVTSRALEMSNVDLATEFVNMITTQRAYQANAKVITTSDQVLQELINMKR
jgi:flagellar hook protein FlgE